MEAKVLECYSPEKYPRVSCIYYGDKYVLFYGNITNNAYVYQEISKTITGVNIIKENDSTKQMFRATSDGSQITLCAIKIIKVTRCFRLLCTIVSDLTIPLVLQKNAQFDSNMSVLFIL